MRLTLRNLLRYLDQSDLRSSEKKQLQKLVEQSEKAESWIKRIESLRHDPRIESPAIDATAAHDINQVSAYLDLRMGQVETSEFEHDLLTSDSLLAEVASCHQIRCAVEHGLPAVPIELRQNIYGMDHEHDQPRGAAPAGDGRESIADLAGAMRDLPFEDRSPEQEEAADTETKFAAAGFEDEADAAEHVAIDEMARQASRNSRLNVLLTILLLVCLLAVAFWLGRQSVYQFADTVGTQLTGQPEAPSQSPPTKSADESAEQPAVTGDPSATEPSGDEPDVSPPQPQPEMDDLPPAQLVDQPGIEPAQPGEQIVDADAKTLPRQPDIQFETDAERVADESATEAPPAQASPIPVGKLATADDILFRLDADRDGWFRHAAEKEIVAGTEFLVLNRSQATILLQPSMQLTVTGPARFTVVQRDEQSPVEIDTGYGRFDVKTLEIDSALIVRFGSHHGELTMPHGEALIQWERAFYIMPGTNPESDAAVEYFTVIAREAGATWQWDDQSADLPPDMAWSRVGDAVRAGTFSGPTVIDLQQSAINIAVPDDFVASLSPEMSLVEQLVELTGDQRKEVRAAALDALASVGNFDFLVDFLNDERNRSYWRSVLNGVRFYQTTDSQMSEQLLRSLAAVGSRQTEIYELINGYSLEQLIEGKDARLVDLLDDTELALRVLAIDNLRTITNGLTYSYRPEADGVVRRRQIKNYWKRKLEKQEIRYVIPPNRPELDITPIESEAVENDGGTADPPDDGGVDD